MDPSIAMEIGKHAGTELIGDIQLGYGMYKNKQAKKMPLPEQDAGNMKLLSEIAMKRKQLESGKSVENQIATDEIGQQLAQTQANVVRAGGGDVGSTMQGLAMAQRGAGTAYNKSLAELEQQQGVYLQLQMKMQEDAAKRKAWVQLRNKLQAEREGAMWTETGMQTIMAGFANLKGMGGSNNMVQIGGGGGGTNPGGEIMPDGGGEVNQPLGMEGGIV
jgi:hypothetical protein